MGHGTILLQRLIFGSVGNWFCEDGWREDDPVRCWCAPRAPPNVSESEGGSPESFQTAVEDPKRNNRTGPFGVWD